jgi:prepilin-type N-terminal cleavage/methylation domain-containing protein
MRKHKGFTLIELVVVVMILGILAAVAAPKLLGTSGTASDNAAKESLGVVRDAIERYTAEHGGAIPAPADGPAFVGLMVPQYLRAFPKCPVGNQNADIKVATGAVTVGGTEGWQYSTADGTFIINSSANTKVDSSATYSSW